MVKLNVCFSGGQKQRIAIARALLKVSTKTCWFYCFTVSKESSGHTWHLYVEFIMRSLGYQEVAVSVFISI